MVIDDARVPRPAMLDNAKISEASVWLQNGVDRLEGHLVRSCLRWAAAIGGNYAARRSPSTTSASSFAAFRRKSASADFREARSSA